MAVAYNPAAMANLRYTGQQPFRAQQAETQLATKEIIESIIDDYNTSQQDVAKGLQGASQKGGMLGGLGGLGLGLALSTVAPWALPYLVAGGTGAGAYFGQKGSLNFLESDKMQAAEKKLTSITKEGIKGREIGQAYDDFTTTMDDQAVKSGITSGATSLLLSGLLPSVSGKVGLGSEFLGKTTPFFGTIGQKGLEQTAQLTVGELLKKPGSQAINALLSAYSPRLMSGNPRSL